MVVEGNIGEPLGCDLSDREFDSLQPPLERRYMSTHSPKNFIQLIWFAIKFLPVIIWRKLFKGM